MPIESTCSGCATLLRVGDEHAGKQARCPQCGTVYRVPAKPPLARPTERVPENSGTIREQARPQPAMSASTWYMQTPERQTYGPVTRDELDRWAAEGRVGADCLIRDGELAPWRSATDFFPLLAPAPQAANPFSTSTLPAREFGRHVEPHRGGMILVLGLLSWITCPVLGPLAWIMGNADLRKMEEGRMDREGMGLTQAGRILGIIMTVLTIAIFAIFLFILLLSLAASIR